MPTVRDIMTRNPVTCLESDLVFKAVEVMKRQDVSAVPIVDQNHVCQGIVTDRDIVMQVIYYQENPKALLLQDIMNRDLLTCTMEEDVNQVIQQMRNHRTKRIVVVDRDNHCLGLISEAELALYLRPDRIGEEFKHNTASSVR